MRSRFSFFRSLTVPPRPVPDSGFKPADEPRQDGPDWLLILVALLLLVVILLACWTDLPS